MVQYFAPESLCVIGYNEGVLGFSRKTGARGGNADEVQAWRRNSVQESGLAVEDFDKSEIQRAGVQVTESEKSCVQVHRQHKDSSFLMSYLSLDPRPSD